LKVYWRTKFEGLKILQGWCYEVYGEVSRLYETRQEAEAAGKMKMFFTKPQRGRSRPTYPKPQRGSNKSKSSKSKD